MKVAVQVVLSSEERRHLEELVREQKATPNVVRRARIVLLAVEGKQNQEIAAICNVTRKTASLWRRRFVENRIAGILDAPRSGRRRGLSDEEVGAIVRKTTQERPAGARWSTRNMARITGLSPSTIGRIWKAHGLKPSAREETAARAAVSPPVIDPDAFERFEGFRETTLAVFTDANANATLRSMADLILTISLEYSRYWPEEPEGYVRHYCRAILADLRHLQGALGMVGELREGRINRVCGHLSPRVKKIGDALEKALDLQEDEE